MRLPTLPKTAHVQQRSSFFTCETAQRCLEITPTWGVLAALPEHGNWSLHGSHISCPIACVTTPSKYSAFSIQPENGQVGWADGPENVEVVGHH